MESLKLREDMVQIWILALDGKFETLQRYGFWVYLFIFSCFDLDFGYLFMFSVFWSRLILESFELVFYDVCLLEISKLYFRIFQNFSVIYLISPIISDPSELEEDGKVWALLINFFFLSKFLLIFLLFWRDFWKFLFHPSLLRSLWSHRLSSLALALESFRPCCLAHAFGIVGAWSDPVITFCLFDIFYWKFFWIMTWHIFCLQFAPLYTV